MASEKSPRVSGAATPTASGAASPSCLSMCSATPEQRLPTHIYSTTQLSVEVAEAADRKPTDAVFAEGAGPARRHPEAVARGALIEELAPNVRTLCDMFSSAVAKYANNRFLGWRPIDRSGDKPVAQPYAWMTYAEVGARVKALAAGMGVLGLARQANVGLYAPNRPEWYIAEYACFFNNAVTVPLYDTLGEEAVAFICGQTEMAVCFASVDRARNLLRMKTADKTKDGLASLRTLIVMDDEGVEALQSAAEAAGVQLLGLRDLERRGSEDDALIEASAARVLPTPEDLFTLCYTSGTTGMPKGVMLTHRCIVSEAAAIFVLTSPDDEPESGRLLFKLGPEVVHMSYLPLAHVYERVVMTLLGSGGASIGFWQGTPERLMDDIAALQPTVFITVPRLLNRIYDGVHKVIDGSGFVSRLLFRAGLRAKLRNLRERGELTHWFWDRLVFGKVRARLGGRVMAILTGSAPVSPEVMDFVRVCFGCEVYEGYGQSETMAGSTITVRGDWSTGHVGVPAPCNEVCLASIPAMGYYARPEDALAASGEAADDAEEAQASTSDAGSASSFRARGEICIRGPNCFVGYYKEPALTADALMADGWVRTGDVGEWDERGRLRIIDRKKNIFKMAQGEYISPERVENVLARSRYVAQVFVDGVSTRSVLVAVAVPDMDTLRAWAAGPSGIYSGDAEGPADDAGRASAVAALSDAELCRHAAVRALLLREFSGFGSRDGGSGELKGFEIPREVHVEPVPFSVDNGLLTVTFKLRRHEAKKQYASAIDAMYARIA